MSATDLWALFSGALPRTHRIMLRRTDTTQRDLARALTLGWSLPTLAGYCTDGITAAKDAGAVMAARLKDASVSPAPAGGQSAGSVAGRRRSPPTGAEAIPAHLAERGWSQPVLPCGCCDGSEARWLELDDGTLRHCPDCWTAPPGYVDPQRDSATQPSPAGVPMPASLRKAMNDAHLPPAITQHRPRRRP